MSDVQPAQVCAPLSQMSEFAGSSERLACSCERSYVGVDGTHARACTHPAWLDYTACRACVHVHTCACVEACHDMGGCVRVWGCVVLSCPKHLYVRFCAHMSTLLLICARICVHEPASLYMSDHAPPGHHSPALVSPCPTMPYHVPPCPMSGLPCHVMTRDPRVVKRG